MCFYPLLLYVFYHILINIAWYVNLFYRIYNGRRKHEILPMKF